MSKKSGPKLHPDAILLAKIGRPVDAAKFFEVTSQAVSKWRREGLPRGRRLHLRSLHPDWFRNQNRVA